MTSLSVDRLPDLSHRTIAIIGASGGTGAVTARLALQAGATVRAVSRSGSAPAGAEAFRADATDVAALTRAVAGSDAVVLMVGAPGRDRSMVRARATASLVEAMVSTGVRRLVAQTSLGIRDSAYRLDWVTKYVIFPFVLPGAVADHIEQEEIIAGSNLDWTLLRPGNLTDEDDLSQAVVLPTLSRQPMRARVPRVAVATCALSAIEDRAAYRRSFLLGSRS